MTTQQLKSEPGPFVRTLPAQLVGEDPSAREPAAGGARKAPSLARGAAQIVASQLVLGVVGVGTLPVLTRQLGTATYGQFSLFVTLLGVVTYQDVARQLLIREETTADASPAELDDLARVSALFIVALALAVGFAVLTPLAAAGLVAAAAFHGLASRDFASLSAAGLVGRANSTRNLAWAGAFAGAAALSLVQSGPWTFAGPFVAANAAVFLIYRRSLPRRTRSKLRGGAEGWFAALRKSAHRQRYRRAALDLLGFTIASSAIASLDRVMLDRFLGGDAIGIYCGAADVALRLHIVTSALSAALFPLLARELHERGYEHAAARFVDIASKAAPLYFVALAVGMACAKPVLGLLLGPDFAPSTPIFVALLAILFLHSFGFLATPWQRAQGDFASQRRAYFVAAIVMAVVGALTIPVWGAWGAVAAFASARVAELQLVGCEIARLPRALLPRWKVAAAAGMFLTLVAFGAWRISLG